MADNMINELIDENPEFANIPIKKIEERKNAELANRYDYYYVPCLWIDGHKLHEGIPTKDKIRDVLTAALKD